MNVNKSQLTKRTRLLAKQISALEIQQLQEAVYQHYNTHKRDLAWREVTADGTIDPYYVVVSEIMLQQTQVDRVKIKYAEFLERFPSLKDLAKAPVRDVLAAWQGLGYNRRALSLHQFAQRVMSEFQGSIPSDPATLETFKGIGPATAASIVAYAWDRPTIFIETNVRTVFIHHFFPDEQAVHDRDIQPLVEQTLDRAHPREWYYALMDYGTMLKKKHVNPSRKSAHYATQSKFEGSDRQVRGLILKMLTQIPRLHEDAFYESIPRERTLIKRVLDDLEREGFITVRAGYYRCAA